MYSLLLFLFSNISFRIIIIGLELQQNKKTLCTEGVLSKDTLDVFPWKRTDQDVMRLMPLIQKDNACQLHFYNKQDMVTCIEALTSLTNNNSTRSDNSENAVRFISANFITKRKRSKTDGNIKLHVAFLGDSRIHQMYMNLILPVNKISS